MNFKELLKSKTCWAGLALICTGVGTWVADGNPARGLNDIFTGLGLIFLKQAITKTVATEGPEGKP